MEPCQPAFHLGEPSRLQNRSWSTRFAVWRLTFHDDLLQATRFPGGIDLVCTADEPDGTLFRYLIANAGVAIPEILHSGQSQHTDMVGGKPLGLTPRQGPDSPPICGLHRHVRAPLSHSGSRASRYDATCQARRCRNTRLPARLSPGASLERSREGLP